mgnify:CR=1 FL=1
MLLSIALILLVGMSMGWICKKIKLPSLLGMMITGMILGPYVLNLLDDSILGISAELRKIALIIILTRAGLGLDLSGLKKIGRPAVMMCFVPATFEIVGIVLLAPKLMGLSILEAAIMGAVLAAVSPAVVVPRMVKLMDDSDNGDTGANHYNFTIAASPDEITPQIVQGNVDIAAVPANLASVLYNKEGVDVSVLAVNTLGVLYIVENGDSVQSVADLKGKTIYASGKGATPEYALNYMLTANGIDPEKDVTIEYKSEHSECVAALAANEDAVAMLPQPFVTVAMTQNENIRVALDLTEEWEKASGDGDTKAALITGVVIARNDFIEAHPDAVETFLQQYEASVNYVNDNVADAAVLVGNYDIVAAQVAEKAIPECNITFIAGNDMKAKLSSYLGILFEQNPAAVGGALPNDDFYYNAD